MRALAVRLWAPLGLVLAVLVLLAPFVSLRSPEPDGPDGGYAYVLSGVDLVTGGYADLAVWARRPDGTVRVTNLPDYDRPDDGQGTGLLDVHVPAQPFAVLALGLVAVGLLGAFLRRAEWRALAAGGAAALAAAALVGAELRAHAAVADWFVVSGFVEQPSPRIADAVRVDWGFAVALGVLLVVAVVSLARRPGGRLDDREHLRADRDVPTP
jgi:hypothetical protein